MNDENYKAISKRLAEERTRLGLSQTKMAELGDYSLGAYHNYETAKKLPDLKYLINAQERGLDLLYVIHGRRSSESGSEALQGLMRKIEQLSEKERAAITALVDALAT